MNSKNEKTIKSIAEWKIGSALIAFLGSVFLILVGSHIVAARYVSVPGLLPEAEGALIGIPTALLLYLSVPRILGIPYNAVFIERPDRSTLRWMCVGIVLASSVPIGAIVLLPGTLTVGVDSRRTLSVILLSAILLGLLAAITEELVFRGYVLSFVGNQWGWLRAIVLSSMLFGLMHNAKIQGPIASELYVLIAASAGLLYALVTYYTKSIWNAVGLHAAWNTVFHSSVLSIRAAAERGDQAILTYEYADSSHLFGGNWTVVTGSPFVLLVLVFAVAIVSITHGETTDEPISIK